MPYIKKERRSAIDEHGIFVVRTAGELNYFITTSIIEYLFDKKANIDKKMFNEYADYNEVIGVLECVKQELYRRLVAPHEDKKKDENGDVFE